MTDQLPKEIESERYGIGCGLRYGADAEPLFSDASLYFEPGNRAIVAEMGRQWRENGGIDSKVLAVEVSRKSSSFTYDELITYLLQLTAGVETAAHVPMHLKRLKNAREKRAVFQLTHDAAADSLNGKPAGTITSDLIASLYDLQRQQQEVPQLITASSIDPQPIRYIWRPWLPEGMLTMFDADPELGKTQWACYVFAQITNGGAFPYTSQRCEPRNVLMIAGEDSAETTLIPRLLAVGANLDRVKFWPDAIDPPTLPSGIERLAAVVRHHDIGAVAFDPVTAYLDDRINANRDSDVRGALRPLIALCQETGLAALGIRHMNKDSGKASLYRGGGSIAFIAAARVAWALALDPDNPDRRILAMNKCNIAKKPPSIIYTIESVGETSRVRWEGESRYSAADILASKGQHGGATKQQQAEQIILDMLAAGERPSAEVQAACQAAGIGRSVYHAARKSLGVESHKGGLQEGWIVSLPEDVTHYPEFD